MDLPLTDYWIHASTYAQKESGLTSCRLDPSSTDELKAKLATMLELGTRLIEATITQAQDSEPMVSFGH